MPYSSSAQIESIVRRFDQTYATCERLQLPEQSHEHRRISAFRIGNGTRGAVLFTGGVHARELVPPQSLLFFASELLRAHRRNSDLRFGPKVYSASTVQLVVSNLQIFVVPNVNPDGREHVLSPTGDPMWRKSRSPNGGHACRGVDLNRNCDFLWRSGIGTSTNPCDSVFKGSAAFSEPEMRNVRSLLDDFPLIGFLVDVHSYSELVLYPWGDDSNQSSDANMNFRNPAYDGMRGNRMDPRYAEYIPKQDETWFRKTGMDVRDAIAAVRGHVYTVKPSVDLYPTSGTIKDFVYSRHFVDATKRKVLAYTLETGREFQPPDAEAMDVIRETASGLFAFCERSLAVVLPAVPNVVGSTRRIAGGRIRAAGLVARFLGATGGRLTWVGSQRPTAGTRVPRGSTVTLQMTDEPSDGETNA